MKKFFVLLLCVVLMLAALPATATAEVSQAEYVPVEITSAQPGQIITFGHYEQDNNPFNGKEPIEWLVLAQEGDKALVISRYALESRPYNDEGEDVTWETCTLRTWLNSTFLITAFTASERKAIPTVTVLADDNSEMGTKAGENTKDKVFLLSTSEFNRYILHNSAENESDPYIICFPTESARASSRDQWTGEGWDFGFGWYLRTPGGRQDYITVAYTYRNSNYGDTDISSYSVSYDAYGTEVNSCYICDGSAEYTFAVGVRPAMWISLDPQAYDASDSPGVRDGFFIDGGVVFLMTDGTVQVLQDDRFLRESSFSRVPLSECEDWTDITQLRACNDVIAGLRADGTVVASGKDEYVKEISKWNHITELYGLSGESSVIAGLRSDGRILILGDGLLDEDSGPLFQEIESWRNVTKFIIDYCFGSLYAAALHKDGTVSFHNIYDDIEWCGPAKEIVDLACGYGGVIAIREDGTCVVTSPGYHEITDTWADLKQVGCGGNLAIGLRNDGTIVTTWASSQDDTEKTIHEELAALQDVDHFECNSWHDIKVYRKDGTVEFFGYYGEAFGNEEIRSWTDIEKMIVFSSYDPCVIIGIKTDGSLVSTVGEIQLN